MHGIKTWHRNYVTLERDGSHTIYDESQHRVLNSGLPLEDTVRLLDHHYETFKHLPESIVNGFHHDGRPIAVVDVDGVLVDDHTFMQDILDRNFNMNVSWRQWKTYNLYEHYNTTKEETIRVFHEVDDMFLTCPVAKLAKTLLLELIKTYHVAIVTSRGFHHKGLPNTARWMQNNELPYHSLHAVTLSESKVDYIQRVFGKAALIIEDSPSTVVEAAQSTSIIDRVFCISQPWNISVEDRGFTRCEDLDRVLHSI